MSLDVIQIDEIAIAISRNVLRRPEQCRKNVVQIVEIANSRNKILRSPGRPGILRHKLKRILVN